MKIGTKSILFGAHCFFIHPFFVAWAWWKLYGFPTDSRLWVAFFAHDIGYWGKSNMDGAEGEEHPVVGANLMHRLFDGIKLVERRFVRWHLAELMLKSKSSDWRIAPEENRNLENTVVCLARYERDTTWKDFALYHSRYFSHKNGKHYSRLCVADKLAFVITPDWFYLICVNLTGEIDEYMKGAGARTPGHGMTQIQWLKKAKDYCRAWVKEHSDLKPDKWTGEKRERTATITP